MADDKKKNTTSPSTTQPKAQAAEQHKPLIDAARRGKWSGK